MLSPATSATRFVVRPAAPWTSRTRSTAVTMASTVKAARSWRGRLRGTGGAVLFLTTARSYQHQASSIAGTPIPLRAGNGTDPARLAPLAEVEYSPPSADATSPASGSGGSDAAAREMDHHGMARRRDVGVQEGRSAGGGVVQAGAGG